MEGKTTVYMDKFNEYNRYEQELMFLNQKYAHLYSKQMEDNTWFDDFKEVLENYNLSIDEKTIREHGLLEILSKLSEADTIDVINQFFRIDDTAKSDKEQEELNNVFLQGLLSDVNRYKTVSQAKDKMLEDVDTRAIILRMGKIIKKDLFSTLKSEKSLLESGEKVKMTSKKKFSKSRSRATSKTEESSDTLIDTKELHDNFTTSILTFHEIEKLYQKYNYVFTLRDLKDTHTILNALKSGEMVMMTGDTGSGKTELSLLIASLYLDEVYGGGEKREEKKPILVTGNSDTDFSDLTVEKIITSKNAITDQNDAISGGENQKTNVEEILGSLLKEKEVKDEIRNVVNGNQELSGEEKEKMIKEIENYDLFKYNIFTEFHLQGIVKAMENGVPLILDEINGISPEVLLGLNHYFTRKVGQEISIGNGFKPIIVKKGFCIICTGNDKNENSKVMRYQGRYDIDESLLNRMYRVCKGYYNQDVEDKDYTNRNDIIEDGEVLQSQIEYMNENELYGVILMLCFNKKLNDKNIEEISDETVLNKIISTQTTAFDLVKESFKGKNFDESKKQVFKELKNLSKFIHLVQEAFQGNTVLIEGKAVKLNNSSFSMRQLVTIIQDWKSDTKSLWYHLYDKYIKPIPENNSDRYGIYLIAKSSGFIDSNENIENKSEIISSLTDRLERQQNEEFHSGANTRNAHIKQTNVDDELLDSHVIITKQDMYKEYFGSQFGDVDDSVFEEEIQQEKKEVSEEMGETENQITVEELKEFIVDNLSQIKEYLEFKEISSRLKFSAYAILSVFCEMNENGDFKILEVWENEYPETVFESVKMLLDEIIDVFQKVLETGEFDSENIENLVQRLSALDAN